MAATPHSSAMLALLDNADPTTTWLLTAAFGLLRAGRVVLLLERGR